MSDRTPGGDEQDAALAHGILDDRSVDRRRFLARLGAAGALGAAYLAFGRDASAMTGRLERLAAPGGAAARPIYMVALGDSVLWGQGLLDEQKFQTKIEKWIAANNPDRRPVHRWNFAHSGASIGSLRGLSSSYSGSGQMTAAVFGRIASANRPGRRGADDLPDFDPRMARRIGSDSTDAPPPRPTGTRSDRKPIEPPEADRLGGEIPRTSPTLWRQLDLALETMRAGKDPRFEYGSSPRIDPADVDLVLLDGGANDVDFLGTILNTLRNRQTTYDYVHGIVYPRMKEFLPHVLQAFPSATVMMNTYYRGISWQSGPAMVAALVQFALAGGLARALLPVVTNGAVQSDQVQATIDRMDGFESAIKDAYTKVVAEQRDAQRIRIVSPDFGAENAYGASRSFLFHIEEADPAENTRIRECDALLGKWFQDVGQTFLEGASHVNPVDTPLWVVCRDANTFHPNVAGANRYFERMRDSLRQNPPPFMKATPQLKVVVEGTTSGDTKTVTVTALDPATDRPVNGTVTVAGVSGPTGRPLSYKASCGTTPAEGGATEAPELPVGPGGRGTRVVRRPVVRTPAVTTCGGTVTAAGYRDATFRY